MDLNRIKSQLKDQLADVFKIIDVDPNVGERDMNDVKIVNESGSKSLIKWNKPSDNVKVDNFMNDVKDGYDSINDDLQKLKYEK